MPRLAWAGYFVRLFIVVVYLSDTVDVLAIQSGREESGPK